MPNSRFYTHIMFILVLSLAGCATGGVRVNSKPDGADVYVAYEGEQPNKIGQTPLTLDGRNLDTNRGKYLNLTVKKEGYAPESILVPASLIKASLDISTRLEEQKLPQRCNDQGASIEKVARGVASVQSLLNRNSVDEARVRLAGLLNEFPEISVLHDLMGNANYMGKNLEAALVSYQRSLTIDPSNVDTQRMVNKLRTIVNVRMPSSAGGN